MKDGRYDYIETGSLISIRKNVQGIVIPSEEMQLTLQPLDFEEFLWAIGNEVGLDILRTFYEKHIPLGESHRSTMRDLRLYMLVGGMPQAVNAYLKYNNLQMVDKVKREIIELYDSDFINPLVRKLKIDFQHNILKPLCDTATSTFFILQ